MSVAPWEFVNNCVAGRDSNEGYNIFLTNRTLSSNTNFFLLDLFRGLNSIEFSSGVPDETRALVTRNLIKYLPKYQYKYVKNAKVETLWKDEDIQVVMFRLKCNELEANEYLKRNFVDQKTLKRWKDEGVFK